MLAIEKKPGGPKTDTIGAKRNGASGGNRTPMAGSEDQGFIR